MGGGLHADCRGGSWIVGLFLHTEKFFSRGESRMVTDVCHEFSFYHELSNFRINTFNHTECRGRSRIIELSNCFFTRRVAEVSNYRIIFTRNVAEDHGFFFTLNVGSAEVWVTRRGGCLFLYVTVKIMCISWVSQTSIRR